MIRKTALVLLITISLLALWAGVGLAQNLSFSLDREVVNAYYNEDGTLSLDFVYDFTNDPAGSPIDYVDVGIPFSSFDLNSASAEVDGKTITDITHADSNNIAGGGSGITLGLHENAIQPGSSGEVHLYVGKITQAVYEYTQNDRKNYASVNYSPSWFGSSFVHGKTDFTVSFHLPPGINPDEPVYYNPQGGWPGGNNPPETALDDQGRVLYTWHSAAADGSTKYTFGAAFPARVIPASAIVKQPAFTLDPGLLICGGIVLLILAFIVWGFYQAIWGAKKRKLEYLPPKIAIEGHGIKRGLTAVEAAILEEQPLDKVMTMILFGLLKKNAATVVTKEPLEIQASDPIPNGLLPYETEFLNAFKVKGIERRKALQEMTINLVKSTSEKMKGFSRKETIDYYQDITKRAWEQVEAAGTPEVKSQKYEEVMDWTMLDRNYDNRTRNVFGSGPVFVPIWWGRYDPVFRGSGGGSVVPTSAGGSHGGGSISMPNVPSLPGSTFAASVVNGAQSFAAGVMGDVTAFTGGITNKTNPPPPPSTTTKTGSWGGGGGAGHCACACACACAGCACACAGGGR